MKRYALFAGDDYDANGGWMDFWASADDVDSLRPTKIEKTHSSDWESFSFMNKVCNWYHIVDLSKLEVVERA